MRTICVALAVSLLACGSSSLPSFDVLGGQVVGSGKNDLWWSTSEVGSTPSTPDFFFVHRVDGADQKIPTTDELKKLRTMVSAGPGTLWVFSAPEARRLVVQKIDGTGAVLADRSGDFEVFPPGGTWDSAGARSRGGVVFISISTSTGPRLYRLEGEQFVRMTPPTAALWPIEVIGPDEVWFGTPVGLVHYKAGTWTDVPNSISPQFLSFDEAGVGYSLRSLTLEFDGPYTDGVPAKTFVRVQRVANDEAQDLRLELPLVDAPGYGFNVFGALARPGGKFALLGGMQRGGPATFESWVVARSGDATSLAKTDTTLHFYSDDCTSRCQSMGSMINLLEDGTFLLNGGLRTDHGGATQVLVGGPANLP